MDQGDFIFINDDESTPASMVSIPRRYDRYLDKILVNSGLIHDRIAKLAEDISKLYQAESLTILVVLKGGSRFAKDLVDALDRTSGLSRYNLEFIRMKSYENERQNEIQVEGLEKIDLLGKNVLIVEDLVDSGKTLQRLRDILAARQLKTLRIAVLLYKRNPLNNLIAPEIIGFSIPNLWIVGYNMDYNERFRELNHIALLNDQGKEAFRV